MGFERFHNDLIAALQAQVPLEMGESRISRLTQTKLNRFRESVIGKFGESPDLKSLELTIESSSELPARYLAALRTFAHTNSMSPVLDGLTNRITSTRKVSRLLGQIFLYLLIVLATALLGLVIFSFNVVPVIEYIREDLITREGLGRSEFDLIAWMPVAAILLGLLLALLLVWLIFGGATRTAMWLGGKQYVRCWSSATALRTTQLLVDSGMGIEDSIQVSCELAGVDSIGRQEIQSAIGQDQEQGIKTEQIGADEDGLRSMANYMLVLAQHRLEKMRFSVPVLLVILIGGTISFLYCTALFSAIVNLLWDINLVEQLSD